MRILPVKAPVARWMRSSLRGGCAVTLRTVTVKSAVTAGGGGGARGGVGGGAAGGGGGGGGRVAPWGVMVQGPAGRTGVKRSGGWYAEAWKSVVRSKPCS